ncbi:GNAT family N-acetyltransferase [Longimicrobium terrae]|uniref:RimJ/RimL family protein N-acetyltransferase n=1 Tax=Longimicrobium terrae TaxID=1639882 RepID=A0A841H1G9_9BACT|nr:GNAT family N-acetyltransferase [Longimicrobium terrae]MBB4637434.1 RimJ/RimL family protein N-acetyltransferase [Longimicrobium terrae]MBB6071832.1 RimJ/RimL family protein N-acetyltransferase [Longimicrobium terrae]
MEILTARLLLREWRDSDREPFARLCADPAAMEFLRPLPDRAAADQLVDRISAHVNHHGWGFWAAELRESREFIGFIGIQCPRLTYPFSPCTEIGWRLAPQHWGRGYATEGARASLRVGFERLGLEEIVSFCAAGNARSREVMHRIGMAFSGHFHHPAMPEDHPLRAQCLFRITASRFAGLPPG